MLLFSHRARAPPALPGRDIPCRSPPGAARVGGSLLGACRLSGAAQKMGDCAAVRLAPRVPRMRVAPWRGPRCCGGSSPVLVPPELPGRARAIDRWPWAPRGSPGRWCATANGSRVRRFVFGGRSSVPPRRACSAAGLVRVRRCTIPAAVWRLAARAALVGAPADGVRLTGPEAQSEDPGPKKVPNGNSVPMRHQFWPVAKAVLCPRNPPCPKLCRTRPPGLPPSNCCV